MWIMDHWSWKCQPHFLVYSILPPAGFLSKAMVQSESEDAFNAIFNKFNNGTASDIELAAVTSLQMNLECCGWENGWQFRNRVIVFMIIRSLRTKAFFLIWTNFNAYYDNPSPPQKYWPWLLDQQHNVHRGQSTRELLCWVQCWDLWGPLWPGRFK